MQLAGQRTKNDQMRLQGIGRGTVKGKDVRFDLRDLIYGDEGITVQEFAAYRGKQAVRVQGSLDDEDRVHAQLNLSRIDLSEWAALAGIEEVEDLRDRTLAFTSETSNSGFKAPSALLEAEYGLVAGTDFEPAFSGAHDNSILGVANRDYEAAAIANSVLGRMIDRDVVSADDIVTVFQSDTFPTTGYGVVHNLHPDLQESIQEAFFSFDWEGSALQAEFGSAGEEQFIPITFAEHWSVIRQIDEAMGVEYSCN